MGQKVNPIGFRLGINRTWDSRWYADNNYADLLHEDIKIRSYLFKTLSQAGVSKVVIERPAKKARITIHTARPGVVIGKKGADIERLRGSVAKLTDAEVHLNIVEIRKPEIDAQLVAENIAQQLERRIAFRRANARLLVYGDVTYMRVGDPEGVFSYRRALDGQRLVVVFNSSDATRTISDSEATEVVFVTDEESPPMLDGGVLRLPPRSAAVLR